jgi:hypothetical protein
MAGKIRSSDESIVNWVGAELEARGCDNFIFRVKHQQHFFFFDLKIEVGKTPVPFLWLPCFPTKVGIQQTTK